jgi:DNA polymerase-3 subunit gamma/tau
MYEPAMSYQVLARKWRPAKFVDVVGQDHVVKSLMNALQHDRLHHAYLFTGTRGVGKTTLARILAKAINCENLTAFDPCGQCQFCRELDEGRFLDLIEVDAASRTKVEDTRDLLDNAQYAPNRGRYKVYLIDEVHMLSGHSFNALLKTLEEPPPHVKFLLATTDPQKIPVTVLSRCLQFNLKKLLPELIDQQMQAILTAENIEFEALALKTLARAADGSMRDGLSLLDQAIVYGGGSVQTSDVDAMLGVAGQQSVEQLMTALIDDNAQGILDCIEQIAHIQSDFTNILQQLLHLLHRIALFQQVPNVLEQEFDRELIEQCAQRLTPDAIQLYYQIALIGQRDLEWVPNSRMGFEMIMLRMLSFKPLSTDSSQRLDDNQKLSKAAPTIVKTLPEDNCSEFPEENKQTLAIPKNWEEIVTQLKIESITRELANNCMLQALDDKTCQLQLDANHRNLLSPQREKKLQQALQDYLSKPVKLIIAIAENLESTPAAQAVKRQEDRQQAAIDAINADANVQALKEHFDARIMPGTIEPV